MPELPEVETIRSQLEREVKGKKIIDVEIKVPKLVKAPLLTFKKAIIGSSITAIKRRAKLLLVSLSNGYSLMIHLKLTGQLIIKQAKDQPGPYTHIIFYFFDSSKLFFNDLRKFGYIKLVEPDDLDNELAKEKFGPEPLEKRFTLEKFTGLLADKKITKIKPLLMDQTFIAGLGNVYAAEVCFYAGVRPTKPAGLLKQDEIKRLYEGIKKILPKSIEKRGSSIDTYVDIHGRQGGFVPYLQVYGRKGQSCIKCKGKVQMVSLAGRGTYFCPNCQK